MAGKVVKKDSLILCPECKKSDYAVVWDENTKETCYSRELRRAYIPLIGSRGIKRETRLHYKCPHCNKFINGWKLIILSSNPE